jgi:outer membrane protein
MKTTYALLTAAAALSVASGALAQAAQPARPAAQPAAPAQTPLPSRPGPTIAGICVVDNEGALLASTVGAAYRARMNALSQQVTAELQPEQTAIQTEVTAVQALAQGAARTTRENALRTRAGNFQNLVNLRNRELEQTQARQLQRLSNEIRPVLDQVYTSRNCSIILDRAAVVAVSPAMDITGAVTTGLNARLTTITFDRERIQQPAAGAR